MAVNAASERAGIGSQPRMIVSALEQEGPAPHGLISSGITPPKQEHMVERDQPAGGGQGQGVAPHPEIPGRARYHQHDGQREHEGALEPTEIAGGLPHDLSDEQRAKRR